MNRKLLRGTIDITKFNILIGLAATLIFFLLIMVNIYDIFRGLYKILILSITVHRIYWGH